MLDSTEHDRELEGMLERAREALEQQLERLTGNKLGLISLDEDLDYLHRPARKSPEGRRAKRKQRKKRLRK